MSAMMNSAIYAERRKRLQTQMQHGIAIIPTAPEVVRNGDAHYDYRHDSHFYYLTGFTEPEAVLVLIAGKEMRKHPVLPRKECRTRDLGWLPSRPRCGKQEIRL